MQNSDADENDLLYYVNKVHADSIRSAFQNSTLRNSRKDAGLELYWA